MASMREPPVAALMRPLCWQESYSCHTSRNESPQVSGATLESTVSVGMHGSKVWMQMGSTASRKESETKRGAWPVGAEGACLVACCVVGPAAVAVAVATRVGQVAGRVGEW